MEEKILSFISIVVTALCLTACEQGAADNDSIGGEGSETQITDVSHTNIFDSGDVITLTDYSSVSSITLTGYSLCEGGETLISSARDLSFVVSSASIDTVYCSALFLAPDSSALWRLCRYDDDVLAELDGVVYGQGEASVDVSFCAADISSSGEVIVGSYAFVKVQELFKDVTVEHNSTTYNPLSATITFSSAFEVQPTMTLVGQDDNDIVKVFDAGTEHVIDVLGLYNYHDNTIYIDCATSYGVDVRSEYTIRPEYEILNYYSVDCESFEGLNMPADAIYMTCGGSSNFTEEDELGYSVVSFGFDNFGKIRWVYSDKRNYSMYPTIFNGEDVFLLVSSNASVFKIVDAKGSSLSSHTATVSDAHHEGMIIDDLKSVVTASLKGDIDKSIVLEVGIESGESNAIDLDDIIDPDRARLFISTVVSENRVHVNSVAYSEDDDCFIVSMRFQGVVKIKRDAVDSSGIVWWMTPHTDVAEPWQSTLLTPTNFENVADGWNVGQHSVTILPNGDFLMFDNHATADVGGDDTNVASRILVMRVDEENMTVTKIHEWHNPESSKCLVMSSAIYYDDSESIVSCWSIDDLIYETSYPDNDILFRGVVSATEPESINLYRFYKVNLYN